jgi:hypothetical protein
MQVTEQPPTVTVPLPPMIVQEYYIGGMPTILLQVLAAANIHFVHVVCRGVSYFIYEPHLTSVVERLKLYC